MDKKYKRYTENMKIGFISIAFPEDLEKSVVGIYKRMHMFIQAMKAMGELDMLFYVRPGLAIGREYVADMEERLSKQWDAKIKLHLCNLEPVKQSKGRWQEYISPALRIENLPPYQQMAQKEQIRAALNLMEMRPDILFIHRLGSMIPVLLSKANHSRVFFDLDDIEHVAFQRSIKQPPLWPGKRMFYLRLPILKLWEKRAIRYSKTTFVCSDHDRDYLTDVFGCANVSVVPNAIRIPKEQELTDTPTLMFLGTMTYQPNVVAADYLIKHIWPTIISAIPDARLFIAGSKPELLSSFAGNPAGVEFLGFVDDLEKLYSTTKVVCCPILSGGGTRIKILEAAAYGKPVVSTTIGAEGIGLKEGEEILMRDDPRSFADACIQLLTNTDVARKMGHSIRSAIAEKYDIDAVSRTIQNHMLNN